MFTTYATATLLAIRQRMIDSLPRTESMMRDGSLFRASGPKACPPVACAAMTAMFLLAMEEELLERGVLSNAR